MREKKTSYVQNNEDQDERLLIRKHARKTVNTIFQVLKRKNCQPRISMHGKNLSKTKVKSRFFSGIQKLEELTIRRFKPQKILNDILQGERNHTKWKSRSIQRNEKHQKE